MNFYLEVLKKYAYCNGRARRTEFWKFFLLHAIVIFIIFVIDFFMFSVIIMKISVEGIDVKLLAMGILKLIYPLIIVVPCIAVAIRRLHDTNHSGKWIFISLLPGIGWMILVGLLLTDSNVGENRYGPNPKTMG